MDDRIDSLVRNNIREMTAYSSARSEFVGAGEIYLDANENSFGSPIDSDYSRYPDPLQTELRSRLAHMHRVSPSNVFVGNGSDESIDLLIRIFCRPKIDSIIICPPTYGMYEVAAAINDVKVIRVPLREGFGIDPRGLEDVFTEQTKLLFLCSPNNPTGNLVDRSAVIDLIREFPGIVVVDEAYMEFSDGKTLVSEVRNFTNLVVIRTFSKAWGLAGLRVGYAIASESIIDYMLRVKPPYNVNRISQELALAALDACARTEANVAAIVSQRETLADQIGKLRFVETVFPSDANFLLIRADDAGRLYRFLLDRRIIVRDRSRLAGCEGCLRITVGTPAENEKLLEALTSYEKSFVY
jgi:histidinol-phosphate aminotransferase